MGLPARTRRSSEGVLMTRFGFVLFSCSLLLVSSRSADASVLHVETNGTDSATCDSNQTSCRSISQAIENAVAGDTIVVGLGRPSSWSPTVAQRPIGALQSSGILWNLSSKRSLT